MSFDHSHDHDHDHDEEDDGGEFEVKAVFFYKRRFAVALTNSGFQRADVSTRVRFGEPVNP